MNILVTGIAGFLGTHIAEYFRKKGDNVIGIDNLTDFELKRANYDVEKSRKHNLDFLKSIGAKFYKKDCRFIEFSEIKKFEEKHGKIDFIIHCAAQPAMTIAIEYPLYDFENNAKGTLNMLEIARKLNVPFINCSSIHVYGNDINKDLIEKETCFEREPKEIDENQPILKGDLTPLHVSKRITELYTQSYAETYGMKTATFRLTGMYGERQFGGMDHGWVANFAIRTIMNRGIIIFDTDKQVRDILYAQDAAKAFDDWYHNGQPTGIYNIGGGYKNSISLRECLDLLYKLTGELQTIRIEDKRFGDLYYFVCDYKKAKKDFKWEPTTSPEEGIKKLIKWIKDNKEIL